jgi:hypothetical protein
MVGTSRGDSQTPTPARLQRRRAPARGAPWLGAARADQFTAEPSKNSTPPAMGSGGRSPPTAPRGPLKGDTTMQRALLSLVATLVGACASAPPTRPAALDPANPNAPESAPPSTSPIAAGPVPAEPAAHAPTAAEPPAAQQHDHGAEPAVGAKKPQPEPPAAPSTGHEHGSQGAAPSNESAGHAGHQHGTSKGAAKPSEHLHGTGERGAGAADVYTCPMHPEVVSPTAGRCSKCGMNLVPKAAKPGAKK